MLSQPRVCRAAGIARSLDNRTPTRYAEPVIHEVSPFAIERKRMTRVRPEPGKQKEES